MKWSRLHESFLLGGLSCAESSAHVEGRVACTEPNRAKKMRNQVVGLTLIRTSPNVANPTPVKTRH